MLRVTTAYELNELREDLKAADNEERIHFENMQELAYCLEYINNSTGVKDALKVAKDLCLLYDLDFNEIIDAFKDTL